MQQLSPTGYQISNFEAPKQKWGWVGGVRIDEYINMRLYELFFPVFSYFFNVHFFHQLEKIVRRQESGSRRGAHDQWHHTEIFQLRKWCPKSKDEDESSKFKGPASSVPIQ